MATNDSAALVQACALRIAQLTTTGAPAVGATMQFTTLSLTSVAFEPLYEDGAEITQDNACGSRIVDYHAPDKFRRGNITVNLAIPNPKLTAILGGGTGLTFGAGALLRNGWSVPAIGLVPENPVSVEVWVKRIENTLQSTDFPYARFVYPLVKNLRLAGWTHDSGVWLPSFSGQAYENANWGNGPLNDWPVASTRVVQWMPESVLPTASDPSAGAVPVDAVYAGT